MPLDGTNKASLQNIKGSSSDTFDLDIFSIFFTPFFSAWTLISSMIFTCGSLEATKIFFVFL